MQAGLQYGEGLIYLRPIFQCSSGPEEGQFCWPKYWPQIDQLFATALPALYSVLF